MSTITLLSLLVIRSPQLKHTKDFYEKLGIQFLKEKHGQGSFHYSARLGSVVFELYPVTNGAPASDNRLGFLVENLDSLLATFLIAFPQSVVALPSVTAYGYRAILIDPDGRKVEVYQKPT
jgi:catechol 2,3-dioxygenase-like lactoylglutathione lyase family enzyme